MKTLEQVASSGGDLLISATKFMLVHSSYASCFFLGSRLILAEEVRSQVTLASSGEGDVVAFRGRRRSRGPSLFLSQRTRASLPSSPDDRGGVRRRVPGSGRGIPGFPATFRGLLELHSRYGPPIRSPTLTWAWSEGFNTARYQTASLLSYTGIPKPPVVGLAPTGGPAR